MCKSAGNSPSKKAKKKGKGVIRVKKKDLVDVPISVGSFSHSDGDLRSAVLDVKNEGSFSFAAEKVSVEGVGGWPEAATKGP